MARRCTVVVHIVRVDQFDLERGRAAAIVDRLRLPSPLLAIDLLIPDQPRHPRARLQHRCELRLISPLSLPRSVAVVAIAELACSGRNTVVATVMLAVDVVYPEANPDHRRARGIAWMLPSPLDRRIRAR